MDPNSISLCVLTNKNAGKGLLATSRVNFRIAVPAEDIRVRGAEEPAVAQSGDGAGDAEGELLWVIQER
jgi:hypothetical protein